jgi:hypothetical protein
MKKAILGSHNSMSYLQAKHWWMRPFKFIARCQRVDIEQQLALGVRYFDLRLRIDKSGNYEFAHGLMKYEGGRQAVYDTLVLLDYYAESYPKDPIYVRVVLEKDEYDGCVDRFYNLCEYFKVIAPNINFQESRVKGTWEEPYVFTKDKLTYLDKYASCNSVEIPGKHYSGDSRLDDLYPWYYAKKNNKKIVQEFFENPTHDILMIDFVDYK